MVRVGSLGASISDTTRKVVCRIGFRNFVSREAFANFLLVEVAEFQQVEVITIVVCRMWPC